MDCWGKWKEITTLWKRTAFCSGNKSLGQYSGLIFRVWVRVLQLGSMDLLETIRKLGKSFRLVCKWSKTKFKLNHHNKKITEIQGKIVFEDSDLEACHFPALHRLPETPGQEKFP